MSGKRATGRLRTISDTPSGFILRALLDKSKVTLGDLSLSDAASSFYFYAQGKREKQAPSQKRTRHTRALHNLLIKQ